MLDKLIKAFGFLKSDIVAIKQSIESLEKKSSLIKDGKPGKDGVSPSIDDIVPAVLAQMPKPKDGKSPDVNVIINEVLASIPKPRDGRDAPAVNVSDIAAIVLAKYPKPKDGKDGKDGRDGPDMATVVKRVKSQLKDGKQGPRGPAGKPGKDGVSVTDVQLNNNELFVFLDGKKKKAGVIKISNLAPFLPGNLGGGGSKGTTSAPVTSAAFTPWYIKATDVIIVPGCQEMAVHGELVVDGDLVIESDARLRIEE